MLRTTISISLYSTISKSLLILGLKVPTTKKQIKSQYIQLAKQNHPDVSSSPISEKKFIQIKEAYKYLSQLSQRQINNLTQQTQEGNISNKQKNQRSSAYEYFSKTNLRRTKFENREESQRNQQKKLPLYKTVPQLFVGVFLVVLMFGQWAYISFWKTKEEVKIQEKKKYSNVFTNMTNYKKLEKIY